MATLDNSPSLFQGESWSTWVNAVGSCQSSDNDTSCDEGASKTESSSMKLRKEDMGLYGACPAQDEFFLSVCERCNQVVKPQALARHIEQRHGQKASHTPKKTKSSPTSNFQFKQSNTKTPHKGHKTSPSSKADKSHRSRSAERTYKDGSDKMRKHLPVIKIERIDEAHQKESLSPTHSPESALEKPKLSFKETYKEAHKGTSQRDQVSKDTTLVTHKERSQKEFHKGSHMDSAIKKKHLTQKDIRDGVHIDIKTELREELSSIKTEKDVSSLCKKDTIPVIKLKQGAKADTFELRGKLPDLPRSSSHSMKKHSSRHKEKKHRGHALETTPKEELPKSGDLPDLPHPRRDEKLFGDILPDLPQPRRGEKGHVDNLPQINQESPGSQPGSLPDLPTGIKESAKVKLKHSAFDNKYMVELPTADLPDPPSARSDHIPSGDLKTLSTEYVSEVSFKQNNDMTITSIPETMVARDSEELVAEFEKMEGEIERRGKDFRVQVSGGDTFDDLENTTSIKVKIESELQKIKVEDKSHIFEIDNRSSTPVLHIPETASPLSPSQFPVVKSEQALMSPTSEAILTLSQQTTVHISDISTLPTSQPPSQSNSRPPSRTNSRPPSRQGSCPSTPIKSEPLFVQNVFKGLTVVSSSYTQPKQEAALNVDTSFNATTSTLTPELSGITVTTMAGASSHFSLNAGNLQSSASSYLMSPGSHNRSHLGGIGSHHSSSGSHFTSHHSGSLLHSPTKKPPKDQKFIPCKDRIYDPEKHCGVWIADQERHCTRSLTCKTHSLSLRRGVQGRSKSFDEILNEHKAAKEAILKAKAEARGEPWPPAKTPPNSHSSLLAKSTSMTKSVTSATKVVTSVTKSMTSTKTVAVTSSSPVMSYARHHKMSPSMSHHHHHGITTSTPVKKSLPFSSIPKPAVLPTLPSDDMLPLTDGEGALEGEEDMDTQTDDMTLPHHPAPLAVNSWGARQYGVACYAFNQRCDRLRNAFSAIVDTHAQPPPSKKLCLENKFQPKSHSSTSTTRDVYKFPSTHSDSNDNVIHTTPPGGAHLTTPVSVAGLNLLPSTQHTGGGIHATPILSKQKSKSAIPSHSHQNQPAVIAPATNRHASLISKPVVKSTVVNSVINSVANSASIVNSNVALGSAVKQSTINATLKRKRSIAVANSSNTAPAFSSPISITIPPGINLASLGSTINATLVANPQQTQASGHSNVSIMVSNSEKLGSIVNGQFVNLQSLNLADVAQLQVNSADKGGDHKSQNRISAKIVPALQSRPIAAAKSHPHQAMHLELGGVSSGAASVGNAGPLMATLAPASTVLVDTHQAAASSANAGATATVAGSFLSSSHVTMDTSKSANSIAAKLSGQHLHNSNTTGIVFKKEGVPNGVMSQGAGIQIKNLPISINHLTNVDNLQYSGAALLQPTPDTTLKLHGRSNSAVGGVSKTTTHIAAKPASIRPNYHPSHQTHQQQTIPINTQQLAATLNLTPHATSRLVAPGNLQHVYATNQVLGGHVTPVQLQAAAKSAAGNAKHHGVAAAAAGSKVLKQPVSLTIVAPGLTGFQGSHGALHPGQHGTYHPGTHHRPLLISSAEATLAKQPDLTGIASSPPGSVT